MPRTGVELARTSVADVLDAKTTSIALGPDAVWFAASSQPRLTRIDPAGSVLDSSRVEGSPSAVAVAADGAPWVVARRAGTVSHLDPRTESVETIDLGRPAGGIAAAFTRVWTSPAKQLG
jgi:streptogramin lyase